MNSYLPEVLVSNNINEGTNRDNQNRSNKIINANNNNGDMNNKNMVQTLINNQSGSGNY